MPETTTKTKAAAAKAAADADAAFLAAERAVEEANKEAAEAGDLAAALEDRVRDGDTTVTAAEVDEAHKLARFAQLRKDAAHRKSATARTEGIRTARIKEAQDITAMVNSGDLDVAPLAAAYGEMRAAMAAFVDAANTYNTAWTRAEQTITGSPARHPGDGPTLAELGVRRRETVVGHPEVIAGDVRRYRLRTREHIARAAVDAVAGISPRRHDDPVSRRLDGFASNAIRYQPVLNEQPVLDEQPDEADGGQVSR